jgi:hypothetical protein
MALVKKSDIESLQRKKDDIDKVLEQFQIDVEASSLKFSDSEAELIKVISDGITSTGANSSGFEELVNISNGRKGLVSQVSTEILVGDNKYAYGGEQIFEITDPEYVEAKEDDWVDTRVTFDSVLKQRIKDIDDAAEARFNTLYGAISDLTEKDNFNDAYKDLKAAFEDYSKIDFDKVISKDVIELMTPIANDWITNNIDNSELLKRYNEEKAERKEAIEDSFVKQDRKGGILKGDYTDITSEMDDLTDDSEVVISELKVEMGIDGDDDDRIVEEVIAENIKSNKIFEATSALSLTRESLFNLDIGGIIDKIKEACYKGETKIKLTGDEVSGTEIYALVKSGYKVTHQKISQPGRNKDNTLFIIDWVSAGGN